MKRGLRIVLASLFSSLFFASTLLAMPDTRGWIHEKSDLPLHPALVTGTLENGIRYAILPHSTPKNRISLHLNVQAGSFGIFRKSA
jgi:zinc protease